MISPPSVSAVFGKPWFKSLTAWGIVLWGVAPVLIDGACGLQLISVENCEAARFAVEKIGGILAAVGIRRAPLETARALDALRKAGIH